MKRQQHSAVCFKAKKIKMCFTALLAPDILWILPADLDLTLEWTGTHSLLLNTTATHLCLVLHCPLLQQGW